MQGMIGRSPYWGILLLKQSQGFCRPGHDFAIEADPVRFQGIPESGLGH